MNQQKNVVKQSELDTVKKVQNQKMPKHKKQYGKAEKGTLKDYRASRGGLDEAINYAFTIAAKTGKPMLVLPGNSYIHRVFVIKESKDHRDAIRTVNISVPEGFIYAQVDPDGTIWQLIW